MNLPGGVSTAPAEASGDLPGVLPCGCTGHTTDEVFFTSAQRDDGRSVILSGPYPTHEQAIEALPADRDWAWNVDPRGPWYAYGTASVRRGDVNTIRPVRS